MDAKEAAGLDKVLAEGELSSKMLAAISMAEEIVAQGEKVVIWSNFRNPIILLEEQLQHLGAVTLFGGTTDVKESVDLFKNVASPRNAAILSSAESYIDCLMLW